MSNKHIHNWEEYHSLYEGKVAYPKPVVRHLEQKDKYIEWVKQYVDAKDDENLTKEDEISAKKSTSSTKSYTPKPNYQHNGEKKVYRPKSNQEWVPDFLRKRG